MLEKYSYELWNGNCLELMKFLWVNARTHAVSALWKTNME